MPRIPLFLLCFFLATPYALAESADAAPGSQAAAKLLKQAERNLAEISSWAADVLRQSPATLSTDHRTALFRAHSHTQRSARALAISSADQSVKGFVSEYQAFADTLRALHRAVVLGEDPVELVAGSMQRAEAALRLLKDSGTQE